MTDVLIAGSWVALAACRDRNPEIFFPAKAEDEWQARAICAGCPVVEACLADALAQQPNPEGIWGNTNKRQRKRIRDGGTAKRPTAASGHAAVNAAKTHCLRNHEYTPENTRWSNGTRSCRTCYNALLRERRAATAARKQAVAA
jgi:WhiB family redox-sensing transcriptional regulator